MYRNELDKACFASDAMYRDSKNLAKRTVSEKIWDKRADKITLNPKCDGYQRELASMVCKFFDRKKDLK